MPRWALSNQVGQRRMLYWKALMVSSETKVWTNIGSAPTTTQAGKSSNGGRFTTELGRLLDKGTLLAASD